MLEIPDIRQLHNSDCGWANVEAILQANGIFKHRDVVIQSLGLSDIFGVNPKSIELFFRHEQFNVISGNMTIDDLKFHLKNKRPVICPVTMNNVGHYICVTGIHRGKITYNDPSYGKKSIDIDKFIEIWEDTDKFGNVYKNYGIAVWK